ncbi:M24 family metallopeptidase [Peribacillus sp. SCS-37]|uniref:M24 family metallopeptidase n=1 Tax=Paraperibacillus esterisolvens TaxID=3115296 RepID=UPI00390689F2
MKEWRTKEELGILSLKKRAEFTDGQLMERLDHFLPGIMERHKADMWIMAAREYNEDPLFETFFPSAIDSSRRLTILVFSRTDDGRVERLALHSDPKWEPCYKRDWQVSRETQFEALSRIVKERSPGRAALNFSSVHAVCDGATHSLFEQIREALKSQADTEIMSSEAMAVEWLETRTKRELAVYRQIAWLTREIAVEALTGTIIPGNTHTQDMVEWIRQRVHDLGLKTSFCPTVDVQRQGEGNTRMETIILPGDIVHLDFGLHYLGLATDTQLLAYVLKPGETEPPEGLKKAISIANRLEDIISANFAEGKTGNRIFHDSMAEAESEGIKAMIYSHPIGVHCHGAGPILGLYDLQGNVPVRGEYPVRDQTCYAMEFNITCFVQEWNQEVTLFMEESTAFAAGRLGFLTSRQTEFFKA